MLLRIYIQYRSDIKTQYEYRRKGCFKSQSDERDKCIKGKKLLKLIFKRKTMVFCFDISTVHDNNLSRQNKSILKYKNVNID